MRHSNRSEGRIKRMRHFSAKRLKALGIGSETPIQQPILASGPLVPLEANSLYTIPKASLGEIKEVRSAAGKRNSTTSAPLPAYLQTRNKFPKQGASRRALNRMINPITRSKQLTPKGWLMKHVVVK
jgi:hypothetical protein